jgi:hypothetical protein
MKKVLLSVAVATTFAFTSCGGVSICDCAKTLPEAMMKDYEAAAGDEAKMKEIAEKYKPQMEACEKLGKDASEEEQKKMMEEAANCK